MSFVTHFMNCSGVISVCDVRTSDTAGFLAVDPKHGVRGSQPEHHESYSTVMPIYSCSNV